MIRLALLTLCALMLVSPETAVAQQSPARPSPPAAEAPPAPEAFTTSFQIFGGDGNFLGVRTEEITRENMGSYGLSGEPRGVGVREVVKDSPAEKAGLRERDVILRFDGEAVTSARKLVRLIDESAPQHVARLTVLRGGSQQEVSATLGREQDFTPSFEGARAFGFDPEAARRRAEEWSQRGEEWQKRGEEMRKRFEEMERAHPNSQGLFFAGGRRIGITTSPLGKQLADYFGVQHGVLVNSVEANSPADKAGLKAGDIVTEAEGERVEDGGDLTRLINRREEGEVTLTVSRDKQRRTVRVTPERRKEGSFNLIPGAVRIVPPVSAISPRLLRPPRAPRAPQALPARPRLRAIRGGVI